MRKIARNLRFHAKRPLRFQRDAVCTVKRASHFPAIDGGHFPRRHRKRFGGVYRRSPHVRPPPSRDANHFGGGTGSAHRGRVDVYTSQVATIPLFDSVLGNIINDGKTAAECSKEDKIREWHFPITCNEMASFPGLWKYHRRLIPNIAAHAEPL